RRSTLRSRRGAARGELSPRYALAPSELSMARMRGAKVTSSITGIAPLTLTYSSSFTHYTHPV
ncbi:MAG: hypothetical protein JWO39_340, partial [Gemmatimonadetes bacterium]|nr:hypothetical protein [Gemmatimonadota bacterium]